MLLMWCCMSATLHMLSLAFGLNKLLCACSFRTCAHHHHHHHHHHQTKQTTQAYNASCGVAGAVIGLQLQANRLEGSVEAVELGALKATMEYLFLGGNNLHGPMHALLQGMARVRRISVARNALTGRLPPSLERMPDLVYVSISNNMMTGEVPGAAITRACRRLQVCFARVCVCVVCCVWVLNTNGGF